MCVCIIIVHACHFLVRHFLCVCINTVLNTVCDVVKQIEIRVEQFLALHTSATPADITQ